MSIAAAFQVEAAVLGKPLKPWVVDAKDIEPEDLDQFHGQLLHLNSQIADFLDPSSTEEMLVIAPKGFGKTLLLKAKRQSMRQRYGTMLPERALVDKPSANPDLMSHREYGAVRETEAYWKALWSIALTLAVEKHLGVCPTLSGPLEKVVRNENLRSACDLFTNLLALPRDAYFAAFKDYVAHLLPVFRRIHSSIAMYVDNIDEYFEDFLAADLVDSEEQRAIYRSYWHFAQVGIALAARDLHAINNHVKIFASIRKEVFQRSFLGNPLGLQLAGSALDLHYSADDLIEIIRKNIDAERKRNLADPSAKDPWVRFFGSSVTSIVHQTTGDEEDVGAFWIRHTFRRPRDIAYIGRDLAAIDPRRRTRETIRHQIATSAAAIAQGFITEMAPHLPQFDREVLFRLVRRNVIPRAELELLELEYDELFAAKHGGGPVRCHAFASMFKIGLLGYVGMHPETAELVQYLPLSGRGSARPQRRPARRRALPGPPQPRSPDRRLQPRLFPPPRQAQRHRRRPAVALRAADAVRAQGRRARCGYHLPGPCRGCQLPGLLRRRGGRGRPRPSGRPRHRRRFGAADRPEPAPGGHGGLEPAAEAAALGLCLRHPLRRRCRVRRAHGRG